jgi:hypothetical protein
MPPLTQIVWVAAAETLGEERAPAIVKELDRYVDRHHRRWRDP